MQEEVKWVKFRVKRLIGIIFYYVLLFMMSLGSFTYLLLHIDQTISSQQMILQAAASCELACCIYYVRKLYKVLISGKVSIIAEEAPIDVQEIGTFLYFIFRPLLGVPFGILTYFIIEVFIHQTIIHTEDIRLYVYLLIIVVYLCGSAIGDYVDVISNIGQKIVECIADKVTDQVMGADVDHHEKREKNDEAR